MFKESEGGKFMLTLACCFIWGKSIQALFTSRHHVAGNNWNYLQKHALVTSGLGQPKNLFSGTSTNGSVCKESNGQFEDPKYCDKYYDCWNGKPVSSGQCSHGLMFNEETSSCDYPANVNCDGKEINQPFKDLDEGCEQPYGSFANPKNCAEYTVCHAGRGIYHTCEDGFVFDQDREKCVPPQDPSCLQHTPPPNDIPEGQEIPEVPLDPDSLEPIPPSGPGSEDEDTIIPIIPDWPRNKCPTNGFLPVVKDCRSVLVCVKGNGYLLTCPLGTIFYPKEARCTTGKGGNCEQLHISFNGTTVIDMQNERNSIKYAYFRSGQLLFPK